MKDRFSIAFFGTPDFSVPSFEALLGDSRYEVKVVLTQPDKPAGRGQLLKASPVKEKALQHNIPVLQPNHVKRELHSFISAMKQFEPLEVGVVIAFGQILPEEILSLPQSGCVNIHASLLPRWRGAAPIQRALLEGDESTGVCLMKMDKGLDTGPVYSCEQVTIVEEDTFGTLHDKLARVGANLLVRDLISILQGTIASRKQPEEGVTYATKVTKEDMHIQWNVSSREILNKIRAFSPVPGAFTFLGEKRLKILQAQGKAKASSYGGRFPGRISFLDKNLCEIETGDGVILPKYLQLEGKKPMNVEEFLRGINLEVGATFGN